MAGKVAAMPNRPAIGRVMHENAAPKCVDLLVLGAYFSGGCFFCICGTVVYLALRHEKSRLHSRLFDCYLKVISVLFEIQAQQQRFLRGGFLHG